MQNLSFAKVKYLVPSLHYCKGMSPPFLVLYVLKKIYLKEKKLERGLNGCHIANIFSLRRWTGVVPADMLHSSGRE